jgi:hypothetical protein
MQSKTEITERIGGALDRGLPSGPRPERAEAIRRSVVAKVGDRAPSRGSRFGYLAVVAAGVAAVVVLVLVLTSGPAQLSFELVGVDLPADEGIWIKTGPDHSAAFVFEEHSRLHLGDESALRVVTSTDEQVLIDLAAGSLVADVVPGGSSVWTVQAGPYSVTVLGTSFTVSWAIEETALEVVVQRGEVGVSGPGIPSDGIVLEAGDRLRANAATERVELGDGDGPGRGGTGSGEAADAVEEDVAPEPEHGVLPDAGVELEMPTPPVGPAAVASPSVSGGPAGPTPVVQGGAGGAERWRELLESGEDHRAVMAAEEVGLDRLCGSSPVGDLWSLANAARYARRSATAKALLRCVRARFAGTRQGRAAAFLLAKVSLDLDGDSKTAYRWLKLYLAENPRGALAEEALGRLFEVCSSTGRTAEARSYAQEYLSRFEGGLFTERARALLQKE